MSSLFGIFNNSGHLGVVYPAQWEVKTCSRKTGFSEHLGTISFEYCVWKNGVQNELVILSVLCFLFTSHLNIFLGSCSIVSKWWQVIWRRLLFVLSNAHSVLHWNQNIKGRGRGNNSDGIPNLGIMSSYSHAYLQTRFSYSFACHFKQEWHLYKIIKSNLIKTNLGIRIIYSSF